MHDDVKDYAEITATIVAEAIGPLLRRIEELESRSPVNGRDGHSVTVADVAPLISAEVSKSVMSAVASIPPAQDGKSVDMDALGAMIAQHVAGQVPGAVADAVASLPAPKDGKDGKDADPAFIASLVDDKVSAAADALPKPVDGKSVTADDVAPLISSEVAKAVAAIPAPKDGVDGKSVDAGEVDKIVARHVGDAVAALPVPKDGKDADPVMVEALVNDRVSKAIAALPAPKDGVDGAPGEMGAVGLQGDVGPKGETGDSGPTGPRGEKGQPGSDGASVDDLIPHIQAIVARAVSEIEPPKGEKGETGIQGERGEKGDPGKDGADVTDAVIDRGGNLLVMLSNGQTKNVGPVIGRDGRDGINGEQGPTGTPGRDGAVIDDFDLVEDDDGIALRLVHGETVKDIYLPIPLDRGVWKEGQPYRKGAGVTWAGSFWLAQEDTNDKPGTNKSWRLVVKKGRDGREVVAVTPPAEKTVKLQ